ncbi:MAG: hypothetical protein A2887_06625 [Alphaproteobacteria bacterium RIFCSPLOWO2_01_FULL_40_26]|nr:MAG: hypothetical protein A3D15_04075 [Alphaproteobacteria bacterium RIFCSPHIGHO2_02_FULL_40_34]OFW86450.1 MAG: hypothetical protein A2794_01490 [Alphaproteobacteria bacterium RIFCSPHIGHO2_01_FULL_40_8]OFW94093.1 MAG: hypothetical protein A2887_06625 [Alphaproteobacteria bacterium RIFCSPLOWO2_01_FULL_40_26]OFX10357.1 MAG: hypothetical protein A3H30_05925 [Alphaproteobacteria bacterium RIFCSPLOWO2_02_FULL_40_19]OFX11146.1 MAG: hypothetical protein A3G22_02330 [Alphaproteobacteria bacterium RI
MRIVFCLLLVSFITSCVTKALWRGTGYDEEIKQFFVGSDGRYIVFVARDYHYVFTDNSKLLQQILSLKQSGVLSLNTKETYLNLKSNNDVKGHLVLEGEFDLLPREDMIKLQSMGFNPDREYRIVIKIPLIGRRYAARYLGQGSIPNENIYKIRIYYSDPSLIKGVGKAAVTPVAVTLDAVILIGKVVILPFKLFPVY